MSTKAKALTDNTTKYHLITSINGRTYRVPLPHFENQRIAIASDWIYGVEVCSSRYTEDENGASLVTIDHYADPLYNRCDLDKLQHELSNMLDMVLVNQTQLKAAKATLANMFMNMTREKAQDAFKRLDLGYDPGSVAHE